MQSSNPKEKHDPGFLFSLNLMLLGGTLLLFVIITLNKLVIHYLSDSFNQSRGILYSINILESETFSINSVSELYLIWFSFLISFAGLVVIVIKLAKSWRY